LFYGYKYQNKASLDFQIYSAQKSIFLVACSMLAKKFTFAQH